MDIKFSKQAVKAISTMDSRMKARVKDAVLLLPDGDVKQLKGSSQLYRLRVGNYRIVFSYVDSAAIYIEKIAPRGDVYKGGRL